MNDKFQDEEEHDIDLMEEESFDTHGPLNEEELKYMYHRPKRKKKIKRNPMYEKALYIGGASVLGVIIFLAILIRFTGADKTQPSSTNPTMKTSSFEQQQVEDLKSQVSTIIQTNRSLEEKVSQLSQDNQLLQQEVEDLKSTLQLFSQSTSINPVQNSQNSNQKINSYIVQKGDTLWSISEKIYGNGRYHTKIMEANGLKDSSGLKAGMELTIPTVNN